MKPLTAKTQDMKTKYITRIAAFGSAALFASPAFAQNTDVHPRGLFETPQEGLGAPVPRTPSDAETLADRFSLSLSAGARYHSNIFHTSEDEESDVLFRVTPTLRFSTAEAGEAENTFAFSYSPSAVFYADHSDRNTVNHKVGLKLTKRMPKTSIGFNVDYVHSTGSDRFVSGFIDRDSLRTTLNVSHILTGKTRVDLGAYYNMDDFGNSSLYGDTTYGADLAFMYQVTGKLAIGPQIGYGVSSLDGGSRDHSFYSASLKFEYKATGKTNLTGNVGYSQRSFSGSGAAGDYSSMTWRIGASHALSNKTNLRASIYRSAKASYNHFDSGYLATGVSLSATHEISPRVNCYATLVYENDDYFRTSAAGVSLDNDYYAITLGGRYVLENGLTLGASATYSVNSSSRESYDFDNLSFGINATYNFW